MVERPRYQLSVPIEQIGVVRGEDYSGSYDAAIGALGDVNERVTRTLYEISEAKGKEAGFQAVKFNPDGTVRPIELRTPSTLFNRAFNEAATRSYLAAVENDVRGAMAEAAQQHAFDPDGFEAWASAYVPTAAADATPELRGTIEAMARDLAQRTGLGIADAKFQLDRENGFREQGVLVENLMGDLHHRIRHDPNDPEIGAIRARIVAEAENMAAAYPDLMTPERLEAVRDGLVIVEQGASLEREAIAAFQRGGAGAAYSLINRWANDPANPIRDPDQRNQAASGVLAQIGRLQAARNASGSGNRRLTPGEMYDLTQAATAIEQQIKADPAAFMDGAAIEQWRQDQINKGLPASTVNRVAGQLAGGVVDRMVEIEAIDRRIVGRASGALGTAPSRDDADEETDRHIQINGGSVNVLTERGPLSNVDPWDLTDPAAVSYQIGRASETGYVHSRLIDLANTGARGDEAAQQGALNLIRALDDGDHYALWNDLWSEMDPVARAYWEEARRYQDPERLLFDHQAILTRAQNAAGSGPRSASERLYSNEVIDWLGQDPATTPPEAIGSTVARPALSRLVEEEVEKSFGLWNNITGEIGYRPGQYDPATVALRNDLRAAGGFWSMIGVTDAPGVSISRQSEQAYQRALGRAVIDHPNATPEALQRIALAEIVRGSNSRPGHGLSSLQGPSDGGRLRLVPDPIERVYGEGDNMDPNWISEVLLSDLQQLGGIGGESWDQMLGEGRIYVEKATGTAQTGPGGRPLYEVWMVDDRGLPHLVPLTTDGYEGWFPKVEAHPGWREWLEREGIE